MAEQQVLTKWCLFWGSGSQHASKTHTQKKIEIKHPGKRYLPTKCRGAAKSWLMHKTLPFWSFFCLHPFILWAFCKTPRFIATNIGVWPLGGIYIYIIIYYTYIYIYIYIYWFVSMIQSGIMRRWPHQRQVVDVLFGFGHGFNRIGKLVAHKMNYFYLLSTYEYLVRLLWIIPKGLSKWCLGRCTLVWFAQMKCLLILFGVRLKLEVGLCKDETLGWKVNFCN